MAHHGTPHKVDKFSLDKIGTGEGVQAYGWGLYFAESDEVAKTYAKVFKRDENLIQKSMGVLSRSENSKEEERSLMQFKLDTSNIEDFLKTKMFTIEDSLRFSLKRLTLS
jgi:hypothetical protein